MKTRLLFAASILLVLASLVYLAKRYSAPVQHRPEIASPTAPAAPSQTAARAAAALPARAATNQSRPPEFDAAVNPYAGALREPGKSKRAWEPNFIKQFQTAAQGDAIRFELTEGRIAAGTIQMTQF